MIWSFFIWLWMNWIMDENIIPSSISYNFSFLQLFPLILDHLVKNYDPTFYGSPFVEFIKMFLCYVHILIIIVILNTKNGFNEVHNVRWVLLPPWVFLLWMRFLTRRAPLWFFNVYHPNMIQSIKRIFILLMHFIPSYSILMMFDEWRSWSRVISI
jgi:hypothetical protein